MPITKEWCERMAKLEGDAEIGAGLLAIDPVFPEHCSFCGGRGTFDNDAKPAGSVIECTWCNGTGDRPVKE